MIRSIGACCGLTLAGYRPFHHVSQVCWSADVWLCKADGRAIHWGRDLGRADREDGSIFNDRQRNLSEGGERNG